jgi:hypothetical protein
MLVSAIDGIAERLRVYRLMLRRANSKSSTDENSAMLQRKGPAYEAGPFAYAAIFADQFPSRNDFSLSDRLG